MRGFSHVPQSIVTAVTALRGAERYSRPLGLQRPMRDATTGLFDPEAFNELATDRIERGTASGGHAAIAVFQLDLIARPSDRSLETVARAIRDSIRPSDLATRTGPTTFVALLDRCEREEAKHVCSRIMRSVMRMETLGSLCCGIAVAPSDGSSLENLVATATRRPMPVRLAERIVAAAS
jgi:diguanylate cyclase (GGDEF)-like protein